MENPLLPIIHMLNQNYTIINGNRENTWEQYFEQPDVFSIHDSIGTKDVILSSGICKEDALGCGEGEL